MIGLFIALKLGIVIIIDPEVEDESSSSKSHELHPAFLRYFWGRPRGGNDNEQITRQGSLPLLPGLWGFHPFFEIHCPVMGIVPVKVIIFQQPSQFLGLDVILAESATGFPDLSRVTTLMTSTGFMLRDKHHPVLIFMHAPVCCGVA